MQRILAIFLCLLVVITPCHSNEAIAVVAVAIGIWPYFGVETLRSNTDQSMAGMIGWGLGEVGWGPGSTNTDWNVLPLTATRGPIGIKTAWAEGYAWRKGPNTILSCPSIYIWIPGIRKKDWI